MVLYITKKESNSATFVSEFGSLLVIYDEISYSLQIIQFTFSHRSIYQNLWTATLYLVKHPWRKLYSYRLENFYAEYECHRCICKNIPKNVGTVFSKNKHITNTFRICVIKGNRGERRQTHCQGFLILWYWDWNSCQERVKNPVIRLAERSKQVVPFVGVTLTHHTNWEDFRIAAFALKEAITFS